MSSSSPNEPMKSFSQSSPATKKNNDEENIVENRIHKRLLELKGELSPLAKNKQNHIADSPFKRMLYSIPVFALFWALYWFFFLKN